MITELFVLVVFLLIIDGILYNFPKFIKLIKLYPGRADKYRISFLSGIAGGLVVYLLSTLKGEKSLFVMLLVILLSILIFLIFGRIIIKPIKKKMKYLKPIDTFFNQYILHS